MECIYIQKLRSVIMAAKGVDMKFLAVALVASMAAAAPTMITMQEKTSMTVEPDAMQIQVSYEEMNREEAPLRMHFNRVVSLLKRYNHKQSLECHGGSYHITPRYHWQDKRQVFTGYHGSVSFQCNFTDISDFDPLSSALEGELKEFEQMKRHQGRVEHIVTEALRERSDATLELQLLERIQRKAKQLGTAMGKTCHIEGIDFTKQKENYPVALQNRSMAVAESIEAPLESDMTLSADATVKYRCE